MGRGGDREATSLTQAGGEQLRTAWRAPQLRSQAGAWLFLHSIHGKTHPLPAPAAELWGDCRWVPPCLGFPRGHGSHSAGAALLHPAKPRVAFLATLHCCLVIASAGTRICSMTWEHCVLPSLGSSALKGTKPPPPPALCWVGKDPSQRLSAVAALGEGPHGGGWWQLCHARAAVLAICSHLTPAPIAWHGVGSLGPTQHPPSQPRAGQHIQEVQGRWRS